MSTDIKHYSMIIQWDERDNIYVVNVPELPGCMTHGKAYEEALPNAAPESPCALDLAFTHIFGKALGGRLDKAELLPVSAIRVGLLGSFAQSV